jgi:hypothetical protein
VNLTPKTIAKFSLAMLMLVSAAFFVVPAKEEVKAQSGGSRNAVNICVNSTTAGSFQKAYLGFGSGPACPGTGWFLYIGQESDRGLCAGSNPPIQVKSPRDPGVTLDSSGQKCLIDLGGGQTGEMMFKTFASITQQYTPPNANTNTNNGNTNNPNTNNTNSPNTNNTNNGGGTTQVPPTGGCETGFHKVGVLCIPNSPVGNNDSIIGETTVGGLAARIVRILLYFAGIVAVIMAIVGGYQIMTAGGNATQATNGRKTLTNAIIGLVIVILSFIIIQAVISFVT